MQRKHLVGHIPQLDGLRAVACALVLVQHSARDFTKVPVFECVDRYGMAGIQLFFALSGFLITSILLDNKHQPHYFRNFFARRSIRLYPLYYGTLALIMIGALVLHRFQGVPWAIYLLYVSNYFPTAAKAPAALLNVWSLCVEEQFYFVWPFFVRFLDERVLTRLAIVIMLVVCPLRLTGWLGFHNTLLQMDALAAGVLIACNQVNLQRWRKLAMAAAWTFPLGIALPEGILNNIGREFEVISACGILTLLLTAPDGSSLKRFFTNPFLRYVGVVSYGAYLLHAHVFNAFRATAFERRVVQSGSFIQAALFLMMEYLIVLALATISYYGFEKPILKLKRYFVSRPITERRITGPEARIRSAETPVSEVVPG